MAEMKSAPRNDGIVPNLNTAFNPQLAREVVSRLPEFLKYQYPDVIANEPSSQFSWDLAMVFDKGDDGDLQSYTIPYNFGRYIPTRIRPDLVVTPRKFKEAQKISYEHWCKGEIASILHLLDEAGLRTYVFNSFAKNENARWYVLVGASEARLQNEAVRTQMELNMSIDGAFELGKFLRFPLALQCTNFTSSLEKANLFENLYCPYPQEIMNQVNATQVDVAEKKSYYHDLKLHYREAAGWIAWKEKELGIKIQKQKKAIIEITKDGEKVNYQVTGISDKNIYQCYHCFSSGCPHCTKPEDINLDNQKTTTELKTEREETEKLLQENGYTITTELELTDKDKENGISSNIIWACKWKEKRKTPEIEEFLSKHQDQMFEDDRERVMQVFEDRKTYFKDWKTLYSEGASSSEGEEKKKPGLCKRLSLIELKLEEKRPDNSQDKEDKRKLLLYENLFERVENTGKFHPNSRFERVRRLKLTRSIIEAPINEGGAGLAVRSLVNCPEHPLEGFFPLHDFDELAELHKTLGTGINRFCVLFRPPLSKMRKYFGEQVAMYFLFLSTYSTWLLYPTFFGVALYAFQLYSGRENIVLAPFFAIFISIWSTCFLDFWKRKMAITSLKWGMLNFRAKETDRPEFQGEWQVSKVKGEYEKQPNKVQSYSWRCCSCTSLFTFIVIIVGWIALSVILRGLLILQASKTQDYTSKKVIAFAPAVINAIVIILFDKIYGFFAAFLNNMENHRTDTEYENSFIAKSFVFKALNAYQSLLWIAIFKSSNERVNYCKDSNRWNFWYLPKENGREFFFDQYELWYNKLKDGTILKQAIPVYTSPLNRTDGNIVGGPAFKMWSDFRENPDYAGKCLEELMYALLTLLVFRLFLQNLIEYLTIIGHNNKFKVKEVADALNRVESQSNLTGNTSLVAKAEEEFQKDQYENFQLVLLPCRCRGSHRFSYMKSGGTLLDYDEMAIQFGYVVLFVTAFPLAPLLALVNNIFEFRLDAHKLTKMTRQPHPNGARDMGAWLECLQAVSWLSIITNVLIVTIHPTSLFPEASTAFFRMQIFVFSEHALFALKLIIAWAIPDLPQAIQEHLSRQNLIHDLYLRQTVSSGYD